MVRTLKYRIYPTKKQEKALLSILDECRWVYNKTLELRKNTWETSHKSISKYTTQKSLPLWKEERNSLKEVHSQILQNVCQRVDWAFQAFFRRVKAGETPGYPRFRSKDRYDSFTYPQFGFKIKDGKVVLTGVGHVKAKIHRDPLGKLKTCSVKRTPTGKWYITISVETETQPVPIFLNSDTQCLNSVGIDLGIKSFAVLSDGTVIENPKFFKTEKKALAKAERKKKNIARVHERIANKRHDFSHKLSRSLVQKYDILCLENLNIQGMIQDNIRDMNRNASKNTNKSINDVAWNQFVRNISYKAEEAGKKCILVDPKNTTQMCSKCGAIVRKTIKVRKHCCPHCKLHIDRDLNASYNILRLGLQSLGTP